MLWRKLKWMDKDGKIVCPRKDKPGIRASTEANWMYHMHELKKNQKMRHRIDYNRFSEGRKLQFVGHLQSNIDAAANLLAHLGPEIVGPWLPPNQISASDQQ